MVSGGLLNLNVTPLEKRFGLTSTQSSLIVVGYDIGFFVMTLFISYYGMNASRPKMVAVGATVFGLGCLLYSLPHFVTENYSFGATGLQGEEFKGKTGYFVCVNVNTNSTSYTNALSGK